MKYSSISNLHPCKAFWGDVSVNTCPSIFQIRSTHQHMHVVCWCFFSCPNIAKKGLKHLNKKVEGRLEELSDFFHGRGDENHPEASNPQSCHLSWDVQNSKHIYRRNIHIHWLKWLFQLDDSKSLSEKWLFHQTSIKKLLFGVPGSDIVPWSLLPWT